jgi:hypothetical protein
MFWATRIKSMCAGMATHDFTLGSGTEELSLDTYNRVKHSNYKQCVHICEPVKTLSYYLTSNAY